MVRVIGISSYRGENDKENDLKEKISYFELLRVRVTGSHLSNSLWVDVGEWGRNGVIFAPLSLKRHNA